MASSTTLKLPEELKERIAPLAKDAGKSAHAWMVEALQERAALAEKRKSFVADALAAARETAASGSRMVLSRGNAAEATCGEDISGSCEGSRSSKRRARPLF